MAHEHPVVDADKRFLIDPITRIVKNAESKKTVLVQNDHNSERLSFELDRYVEGHDMLESTSVHIHYDNVGNNKLKNSGVYEVDDIQPSPDDSTKVVFTWLVSQHATSLVGTLNFSITFECDVDGVVEYRWSTVLNTNDVQISEGLDNGEVIATTYADILTKWKNELYSIMYTNPTFAEVCRWEDDNLDDENRIGYFVTVEQSDITEETLIVKATAASEVRGITMESPGFAANQNDYKFDENGDLLPQYEYVGFSGFIPVIDNGMCSANGWCKPGDNGTAMPTDSNTGYRVIERVDENHVLVLMEPQGTISTLIAKDTEIIEALTEHVTDFNGHTANKSNPHGVTAAQTGALKVYNSISELGLDEKTATAANIVNAMANGSILLHAYGGGATSAALKLPQDHGLLKVVKRSVNYSEFNYTTVNVKYSGYYNASSTTVWTDWIKEFNSKQLPKLGDIGGVNPNILHNWYFPNPVNRNGQTEYTSTTDWVSTIDRFRVLYSTLTVGDGYCKCVTDKSTKYKRFVQQILGGTLHAGQKYTLSMLAKVNDIGGTTWLRCCNSTLGSISNGGYRVINAVTNDYALYSLTFAPGVDVSDYYFDILTFNAESDYIDIDIKAVKLELGDQQTLAHQDANGNWVLNEIPDYAEQMAICSQYDQTTGAYMGFNGFGVRGILSGTTDLNNVFEAGGYYASAADAAIILNTPITSAFQMYVFRADTTTLRRTVQLITRVNASATEWYIRKHVDGSWSNWREIAFGDTTLPLTGGKMSGLLEIIRATPEITLRSTNHNRYLDIFVSSSGLINIQNRVDNSNFQSIYLGKETSDVASVLQIERVVAGKPEYYKFYHSGSITAGTTDLTAGTTALATDCYYDMYE